MTLKETMEQLELLGNEARRAHNTKYGAGDNQFGVQHGDIQGLAKKIKTNHVGHGYPCSKGCTSPFAPIWINFMVSRQVDKKAR